MWRQVKRVVDIFNDDRVIDLLFIFEWNGFDEITSNQASANFSITTGNGGVCDTQQ